MYLSFFFLIEFSIVEFWYDRHKKLKVMMSKNLNYLFIN